MLKDEIRDILIDLVGKSCSKLYEDVSTPELVTQALTHILELVEKEKGGMIKVRTIWLPRPSSDYPGCYPNGFEKMIEDLVDTQRYAHLFCGKAKTGYRIDINPKVHPDLIANIENLSELPDNAFKGIMADPPYTKEFANKLYKTSLPKWSLWTKEAVRILSPGGKIAIMHNYVVPRLPQCSYVEILVIITRIKQYPKIVTIQRKKHFND